MNNNNSKNKLEDKLEDKYDPIYDSLALLPCLYEYDNEDYKILADIYTALKNKKAFINLIFLFSGKTIKIPEIDQLEFLIRIVIAYNEFIKTYGPDFTDPNIRIILSKNKIKPTKENVNMFKRIDSFLKQKL